MTLYDHQKRFLEKNPNKCMLCWETGTGKTVASINWSKERDGSTLIVCPKSIKANWKRALNEWGGSAEVLTKEEFRKFALDLPKFENIVVDECFVAGTKVLTPSGYKNIEDIKTGEKIISAIGLDKVYHVGSRIIDELIIIRLNNNKNIVTTRNHLFLTSSGWKKAEILHRNSVLLHYYKVHEIMDLYDEEKLQKLWQDKSKRIEESNEDFLFKQLYNETSLEYKERRNDKETYILSPSKTPKSNKLFIKNEKKKSNEESRNSTQSIQDIKKNRSQANHTGWQWKAIAVTAKNFIGRTWERLGTRIYFYYWTRNKTESLQNRYREQKKKDSYRNRWELTQSFRKKKARLSERRDTEEIRVESIEIQKRKGTKVFNIGVEKHPSYIVGDVLVHNCHFFAGLKSQMSKNLRKYINQHKIKNILLMTATPYTSTPWSVYVLANHLGAELSYGSFMMQYFYQLKIGRRYILKPKNGVEEDLAKIVKKYGDIVRLEDCIDMPDSVTEVEYFELSRSQKQAIEGIADPEPLIRHGKTHQIENGVLLGGKYEEPQTFKCDKNERIKELCEENDKIMVVCRYNFQIDTLKKILEPLKKPVFIIRGDVEDRDSVIQEAEASKQCILLAQAETAEGWEIPSINLMVFASLSYSYVKFNQMQGRIRRINKPGKKAYLLLVTAGGVDEAVYRSIKNKENFSLAIYAQSYAD